MIQYDQNGLIIQSLLDILSERENSCQKIFGDDFKDETGVNNQQLQRDLSSLINISRYFLKK